jgi:hypothetical protein
MRRNCTSAISPQRIIVRAAPAGLGVAGARGLSHDASGLILACQPEFIAGSINGLITRRSWTMQRSDHRAIGLRIDHIA